MLTHKQTREEALFTARPRALVVVRGAASVAVRGGLQHSAVAAAPPPSPEEATGRFRHGAGSNRRTAAAAAVAVARAGPPPCRAAGARRSGTRPGPRRSLAKCKQAAVVRGNGGARAELGSSRSERQAGASAHLRQSTPCCSPRQATALPLPGSSWYTPSSVSLLPQMTFHASSQNSNQNRPSGAPDHTTARRPDHKLLCGTLARPRPAD